RPTPTSGPLLVLYSSPRTTFRSVAIVGHRSQVVFLGVMTTFIPPKPAKWVNVGSCSKLMQVVSYGQGIMVAF
ncbi:unnamed protein product, partial [Urochloa humidicola]